LITNCIWISLRWPPLKLTTLVKIKPPQHILQQLRK
jgi:hypothetical protein